MTHPLQVAKNCTTHPLPRVQKLMTHPLSAPTHPPLPPILFDKSLSRGCWEANIHLTAPFLLLKIKIIRTRTMEKLVDHGFSFIGNRLSTSEEMVYVPDCI